MHQCVQEGLRGDSLIAAIRGVITRVTDGGEVGDRRHEIEEGHKETQAHRDEQDQTSSSTHRETSEHGKSPGSNSSPGKSADDKGQGKSGNGNGKSPK